MLASTIILRFRDLATALNETVRSHNELITSRGCVWWGWWHKLGEAIPDEEFRRLAAAAKTPDLVVYLYDSGQDQLFEATCTDIYWSATHDRVPSPEPEATPAYYRTQTYLSWFKFTKIQPLASWPLQRYQYHQVNAFFRDGRSRYTAFYGKCVYSGPELRQQDRSIWFIVPADKSTPCHEIVLTESEKTDPVPFPPNVISTASRNLLWVSDTHFSDDDQHAFPRDPTPTKATLGVALENALKDHRVVDIAAALHTGDLTWRATSSEFGGAASFLKWVRSFARLQHVGQVIVCPGNHDLAFSANPAKKEEPITITNEATRAEYSKFYAEVFSAVPSEFLCSGRRLLLGGAYPVEVVALNSSLLQQAPDSFQGHGFLGDAQLRYAAERMGWTAAQEHRPLRVAMLHHHVMPTTYRDEPQREHPYSVVLDAEAFVRWIVEHRVDIVLHGHMHQPFCARVSRPVPPITTFAPSAWHSFYVLGMGSSGVEQAHLGEFAQNVFAILTVEREKLLFRVYTVHPTNKSEERWNISLPLAARVA